MLYTDGTAQATREEVVARIAEMDVEENAPEAQATADGIQAFIDADEKLTAAEVSAAPDPINPRWVRLVFPADGEESPYFWLAVSEHIVTDKGIRVDANTVRVRVASATRHLEAIAAAL